MPSHAKQIEFTYANTKKNSADVLSMQQKLKNEHKKFSFFIDATFCIFVCKRNKKGKY